MYIPLLIALATIFPQAADAQDIVFSLQPAQSSVDFTLGAFLHAVHGSFKLKTGTIHLDPDTGKAQGEIDVDLTTGTSGIRARDDVMSGQVLESARYPDAVFTPDTFTGRLNRDGRSNIDLQGRLAIHGSVHDWTLHTSLALNGAQATATAHGTIPYAQWGMKNPSTFLLHVNDHVDVNVQAVAQIRPATP
jgi:polyisoprenoid-binding protein YceI